MAQAGSGRELQANFQLCSRPGTPGALVIYGPCQVEGGEKKSPREGLPLSRGAETGRRRGAPVIPELSEQRWRIPESPLLFIKSWKKGAEVRRAGKSKWISASLLAQVLSTLEHSQRNSLALPP